MPGASSMLLLSLLALASASVFKENFDGSASEWVTVSGKGKVEVSSGKYKGDPGLQTKEDAKFYASSRKIPTVSNKDKDLVVSFSVTHEQNIDCGGGYLKLLPEIELSKFDGDSKYTIMFGPDICGATKKIHLIFEYKGKNLLWKKEPRAESDVLTHFYTLVVKTDNTYEVYVDNVKKESGKLEEDWDFLKPKTIADPNDKKPEDWVDESEIADPNDKKPEDWDSEPSTVADPQANKPEDWDEEEDGDWEAPTIPNPKYKGEWKAKSIPNPKYKGEWKAKEVANPEYEADEKLYLRDPISVIGLDLWQVKSGTIFDNIIISDNLKDAQDAFEAYKSKLDAEKKAKDSEEDKKRKQDEEDRKKRETEEEEADNEEDEDEEDVRDDL